MLSIPNGQALKDIDGHEQDGYPRGALSVAPHCDFWLQHVSCVMMLKLAGISRSPIALRYAPRVAERALPYASLCIRDIARDGACYGMR